LTNIYFIFFDTGAIYLEDGGRSSLQAINGTTFSNNVARTELWDGIASGGAIYVGRGNIIILKDCLFINNKANADRSSAYGELFLFYIFTFNFLNLFHFFFFKGGALDIWGTASIVQVRFLKNNAIGPNDVGYSATRSIGAGLYDDSIPTTGSVVSTPTGVGNGGSIVIRSGSDGTTSLVRCEMSDNYASSSGGALFNDGGRLLVRDSTGKFPLKKVTGLVQAGRGNRQLFC
jgi:hypothetical protein